MNAVSSPEARLYLTFIRRIFLPRDGALNLAVLRIAVFGTLLAFIPHTVFNAVYVGKTLRIPPFGYESFFEYVPFGPSFMYGAVIALIISSIFGFIGFFSRTASFVAFITGLYVYGIPQLFGKINHETHHLFLFLLLLACSPCGDALSADAHFKRTGNPPHDVRYGIPLHSAWLLIGVAYFFSGLWKLRSAGWNWTSAENIQNILNMKWAQLGPEYAPLLRVDQYESFLHYAAIGVLLFELTFMIGIFIPRWRYLWIIGGIIFHSSTALLMSIEYWPLVLMYVCFIDWDALFKGKRAYNPVPRAFPTISTVSALVLITLSSLSGAFQIQSWPFGVYPTFAGITPHQLPRVSVTADIDGKSQTIHPQEPDRLFGEARWAFIQQRMIRTAPGDLQPFCEDVARELRKLHPGEAIGSISFHKELHDTRYDHQADAPLESKILCTAD